MDKEGIHTKCLDRLVDNDSRVLIVGTLPGQESINAGRYYADKKNQFWNILYGAFNVPYDSRITDKEKCDFLRLHRIALWDVLEKGERKGSSSDKDIHRPVMNDFEGRVQSSSQKGSRRRVKKTDHLSSDTMDTRQSPIRKETSDDPEKFYHDVQRIAARVFEQARPYAPSS